MATVVVMPQLGNSVESCLIVSWQVAVGDEIALFEAAFSLRMPLMLKGPTGCGKSRLRLSGSFVQIGNGVDERLLFVGFGCVQRCLQ